MFGAFLLALTEQEKAPHFSNGVPSNPGTVSSSACFCPARQQSTEAWADHEDSLARAPFPTLGHILAV